MPQGGLITDCAKEPNANFLISCVGDTCTFSAANENASSYYWELKNNPANRKAYKYGQEPRTISLDETMQIECQPGWIYEEDPNSPLDARAIRCVNPASAINMQGNLATVETTASEEDNNYYALMGFTLAPVYEPPHQTISVGVTFLVWDVSFDVSFWFRASMDLGLRLPIQVNITEPDQWNEGVWAGDQRSVETSITPKDFNVAEFKKICEDNQIADGTFIHDCDAFSFPDFLNPEDGDEFAARYDISAGVDVPSIEGASVSVHQGMDIGQICTISNMLDAIGLDGEEIDQDKLQEIMENLATLGVDFVANGNGDLYQFLKDQSILCGSFTTPYGYEDDELRTFPFIPEAGYNIPANCINAETIKISGADRPICTGLYLGVPLASIGIGLNLKVQAGSDVISADWSTAGDAKPASGANTNRVRWVWDDENPYADEDHSMPQTIGPIIFDNYDLERSLDHDVGSLVLDNFNYNLNFWLRISAGLEFGGILAPLSVLIDNTELELYSVSFRDITGIDGIPIPQHSGMDPLKFSTNVKNYGVDVTISPDEFAFPANLNPVFTSHITNIGSLFDSFNNFRVDLSNIPSNSPIYNASQFVVNQNNDYDCLDVNGAHLGGPGKELECYQANGTAKPGVTLLINEDGNDGVDNDNDGLMGEDPSQDQWSVRFLQDPVAVTNLAAYEQSSSLQFIVTPFSHSMTPPGIYPIKLLADSVGSNFMRLPALFPLPITSFGYDEDSHVFGRIGAFDIANLRVEEFANPQAVLVPGQSFVLPGAFTTYKGVVTNSGNATDIITVGVARPDLNQSDCTIINMGQTLNCPYRALVTRLPDEWVTDRFSASYGPLEPAGYDNSGEYIIKIPADWAGMQDLPYQLIVSAGSDISDISNDTVVVHTVKATLESRTRFIIRELNDLIAEIDKANQAGVKTCNLKPVAVNTKKQSEKALQLILAGKSSQALNALSVDSRILQTAFMNGLRSCKRVPDSPWRVDWQLRAQAIINDLRLATGKK